MACNHTLEEMRQIIGADTLGFLSVDSLGRIAPDCRCGFCTGCFTQHYPIPIDREESQYRTKDMCRITK